MKSRKRKVKRTDALKRLDQYAHGLWALTATPIDKRQDLYGLLKLMHVPHIGSYSSFLSKYTTRYRFTAENGKSLWAIKGYAKNSEWRSLLSKCSSRAYPDEILKIPTRLVRIPVELSGNQLKLYNYAKDKMLVSVYDWENLKNNPLHDFNSSMEQRHRLLQLACDPRLLEEYKYYQGSSAKLEALKEFIENFLKENQNEKIMVWYYHQKSKPLLEEYLKKFNPLFISHDMTNKEHQESIAKFKEPYNRLLCLSLGIGGESMNFQYDCATAVYLELDWSLTKWDQTLGRLKRIGQTKPVTYYVIIANGTMDEHLWDKVMEKSIDSTKLLDPGNLKLLYNHTEETLKVR